jgi:hypothetical protein
MGNLAGPSGGNTQRDDMANRWESRMRGTQPVRVKAEKYEDDFKREGRQQERVSKRPRIQVADIDDRLGYGGRCRRRARLRRHRGLSG